MTIPCQLLADCSLRLAGLKGVPNSFSAFARNTLDPRCGSGWFSRSAAREDGLGWCRLHKTIDTTVARKLLVSIWYILSKRQPYSHFDDETIAYKMLIWSQRMDAHALKGMSRQQFAKYGLLRIGVGHDITRIVRSGLPRRIAPASEIYNLKPELRPPE